MMHADYWPWILGSGQLLIAGTVTFIAWRQHKTARDKLRLDLFEKRFAVYRALIDKVREPDTNEENGRNVHDTYRERLKEAPFLYEKDVNDLLGEVWDKSIKLSVISRTAPDDEPEHMDWVNRVTELRSWFNARLDGKEIEMLFEKYLNFKSIRF